MPSIIIIIIIIKAESSHLLYWFFFDSLLLSCLYNFDELVSIFISSDSSFFTLFVSACEGLIFWPYLNPCFGITSFAMLSFGFFLTNFFSLEHLKSRFFSRWLYCLKYSKIDSLLLTSEVPAWCHLINLVQSRSTHLHSL